MKIIVCVKQVPDTTEIRINPETGTLIRDGVPSILNPDDANALEQALAIKDSQPDTEVVVDVRQQSAIDSKNAVGFIEKIAKADEGIKLKHINLEMLSNKNKVEFFDRIAAYTFKLWQLKTITGITVKQGLSDEDDEDEEVVVEENEGASTLTGISQAVLNGNGLRSNEFVQESIEKGYYITAMKYRYEHRMDMTEFAVVLSFKNKDLRVDIDKTYYEDDGKIYVQPLIKSEQDEIIVEFQDVAYRVFNELINEQLEESKNKE